MSNTAGGATLPSAGADSFFPPSGSMGLDTASIGSGYDSFNVAGSGNALYGQAVGGVAPGANAGGVYPAQRKLGQGGTGQAKPAPAQFTQLHGNTVGEQIADAYQQFTHPKPPAAVSTVPPRNIDPTVPGTPAYAASHTPSPFKPLPTGNGVPGWNIPAVRSVIESMNRDKSTWTPPPTPEVQQSQGSSSLERDVGTLLTGMPMGLSMLAYDAGSAAKHAVTGDLQGARQRWDKAVDAIGGLMPFHDPIQQAAQSAAGLMYAGDLPGGVGKMDLPPDVAAQVGQEAADTYDQIAPRYKEAFSQTPLTHIAGDILPVVSGLWHGGAGAAGELSDRAGIGSVSGDFTPDQVSDLSRYAGVQDRPAPAAAPPDGAAPAPSGNVPTPLAAIEARPSETLANALATRPQEEQVALRNDLVPELQGNGPEGTIALYQAMGIPHTVFTGRGSFEGTITPNYNVLLHSGDMTQARLVAAIEGIGNVQDAAAIIKPVEKGVSSDETPGILSYLVRRLDGALMSDSEVQKAYNHVNRNASDHGRLEFSETPDGDLLFGNYGSINPETFATSFEGFDPARYTVRSIFNDGDYIQGYDHGNTETNSPHEPSGYGSVISEARVRDGATGRPDISSWIDRYFTAPRLRAYTGVAQRAGIDPGPIQRQILEAGEHVKRALGPPDNGNPPQGPPSGGPSGFTPPAAGGATANPAAPLPPQPPGAPGPSAPAGSAMRVVMPGLLPRGPALSSAFDAFGRPVAGGYASKRSLPFGTSPDDYDVSGQVAHAWGLDGRRFVFRAPRVARKAMWQVGASLRNSGDSVWTTPDGTQYVFLAREQLSLDFNGAANVPTGATAGNTPNAEIRSTSAAGFRNLGLVDPAPTSDGSVREQESGPLEQNRQLQGNAADPPDSLRNYRRGGFRAAVRKDAFEGARHPETCLVYDPYTGEEIKFTDKWNMGHKPGYEFWKHVLSAVRRNISRQQFLDEYNDYRHYRPETPATNRSHRLEADDDVDHWAALE